MNNEANRKLICPGTGYLFPPNWEFIFLWLEEIIFLLINKGKSDNEKCLTEVLPFKRANYSWPLAPNRYFSYTPKYVLFSFNDSSFSYQDLRSKVMDIMC
jgi:hypothetical protein